MKRTIWPWLILLNIITFLSAQTDVYVLCEGNFSTPNSTLWQIADGSESITGPVYWDPNTNPLGDTGQSLTIHNDQLLIVMNNSHTVEIADIRDGFDYRATLNIPNSGPRYLAAIGDTGYLTTWNLGGILVIDLINHAVTDTIAIDNYKLEQIAVSGNDLYVAAPMDLSWAAADKVFKIDVSETPVVTDTFTVVPGPESVLIHEGNVYVGSTYYDESWNSQSGTSRINMETGEVTSMDYETWMGISDLLVVNNQVFRGYEDGIAPLTATLDIDGTSKRGAYAGLYTAAGSGDYLYFGITSDFTAPDTVIITDTDGSFVAEYQVGTIPGDFAFYSPELAIDEPHENLMTPQTLIVGNYPNPFNAQTILTISLESPVKATIHIYNVKGQRIDAIAPQTYPAGTSRIKWNPNSLPSGEYFMEISTAESRSVHKVSIIK